VIIDRRHRSPFANEQSVWYSAIDRTCAGIFEAFQFYRGPLAGVARPVLECARIGRTSVH
jgi:hypothetical protein